MLLLSRPPTRGCTLLQTSNQIRAQVTNNQLTHASNDSMVCRVERWSNPTKPAVETDQNDAATHTVGMPTTTVGCDAPPDLPWTHAYQRAEMATPTAQFGMLALAELLSIARTCLHGRRPIGPPATEADGLANAVGRTFGAGRGRALVSMTSNGCDRSADHRSTLSMAGQGGCGTSACSAGDVGPRLAWSRVVRRPSQVEQ